MSTSEIDKKGVLITASAFFIWGVFPLYWSLLKTISPLQIMAHRVIWSAFLVVGWLVLTDGFNWWKKLAAQRFALLGLSISSVLIAFNWGLYIWAVNSSHIVESSLGYYINPLFNVLLGVLVLKEKLRQVQWVSILFAAAGVGWLTYSSGTLPWIALCLAGSFALYGLIRKIIATDAVAGLGVESVFLFIPAVIIIIWGEVGHGGGFFSSWSWKTNVLLMIGGIITAVPLIAFAYGVKRIPLTIVGVLQYIGPTLQLLLGVFIFKEVFDQQHIIGFICIWLGLLLFVAESWLFSKNLTKKSSVLHNEVVQ